VEEEEDDEDDEEDAADEAEEEEDDEDDEEDAADEEAPVETGVAVVVLVVMFILHDPSSRPKPLLHWEHAIVALQVVQFALLAEHSASVLFTTMTGDPGFSGAFKYIPDNAVPLTSENAIMGYVVLSSMTTVNPSATEQSQLALISPPHTLSPHGATDAVPLSCFIQYAPAVDVLVRILALERSHCT